MYGFGAMALVLVIIVVGSLRNAPPLAHCREWCGSGVEGECSLILKESFVVSSRTTSINLVLGNDDAQLESLNCREEPM